MCNFILAWPLEKDEHSVSEARFWYMVFIHMYRIPVSFNCYSSRSQDRLKSLSWKDRWNRQSYSLAGKLTLSRLLRQKVSLKGHSIMRHSSVVKNVCNVSIPLQNKEKHLNLGQHFATSSFDEKKMFLSLVVSQSCVVHGKQYIWHC